MIKGMVAWLVAAAALAPPAFAQDTPFSTASGGRPVIRADGTYMFNFLQYGLVFEGQIAPRIIVKDSIGERTRRLLDKTDDTAWGWQASVTPMVRLRMFDEASNPVRTPSYMPKGTLQLARLRNLADPKASQSVYSRGPMEMLLVELIPFGHHSNGQNNCLFQPRASRPGDACVEPASRDAGAVNSIDGSFSTNYVELTAHYGRMRLDADGAPEGEYAVRSEWSAGGGVQLNPVGYGPGAIDPVLAARYGTTRLLLEGMMAWRSPAGLKWFARVDVRGRLEYIGNVPGVPPLLGKLEVAALPRGWGGAGVFLRYYGGQDYYNLGFDQSIHRLHAGFALQRDTFLSFAARSMQRPGASA
jgi:hypothetical protein